MPHLTEAYPGHAAADASGGARGKCISRSRAEASERRIARDRDLGGSVWSVCGRGVGLKYGRLGDYVHAGRHT